MARFSQERPLLSRKRVGSIKYFPEYPKMCSNYHGRRLCDFSASRVFQNQIYLRRCAALHEKVSSQRYEAHFRDWTKGRGTRWIEMQRRCLPWFPILRRASYVSSMFVTLPVERGQMNTDGRPTLVTDHGYGCWSVLSGKIMTSVKAARQICEGILQGHRN